VKAAIKFSKQWIQKPVFSSKLNSHNKLCNQRWYWPSNNQ